MNIFRNTKMTTTAELTTNLTPEQVIMTYGKYLSEKNIEKIIPLFHDAAEIIPDQLQTIVGKNSITPFYHQTFNTITIEGDLCLKSIYQSSELAIIHCEEEGYVTALETNTRTKNYFRELFVLLKTEDKWLIYKYMFSKNNNQIDM